MNAWEYTINTGNPDVDRQTLDAYRQSATSSGMLLQVQQLPTGGFHVRMSMPGGQSAGAPAQPQQQQQHAQPQGYEQQHAQQQHAQQQHAQQQHAQQQYAQQQHQQQQQYAQQQQAFAQPTSQGSYQQGYQQQQQAWAQQAQAQQQAPAQSAAWQQQQQLAFAGGGGGPAFGAPGAGGQVATQAPALSQERIKYLRKVYGLLSISVALAIVSGYLAITVGGTEQWTVDGHQGVTVAVPAVVRAMLENPGLMYGAFGALFVMTLLASWTSRVPVLNVIMLFSVCALMGLELAPMVFIAQIFGGLGDTLSANPVRDTFAMVGAVYFGVTGYVFVTRKDFSYLRSILVMGTMVVFVACIMGIFMHSEIFSLAVASVGALLSIGFLLYQTSYILRKSKMDNAVGDALVFIVQLRNLFMFILRILMSARR